MPLATSVILREQRGTSGLGTPVSATELRGHSLCAPGRQRDWSKERRLSPPGGTRSGAGRFLLREAATGSPGHGEEGTPRTRRRAVVATLHSAGPQPLPLLLPIAHTRAASQRVGTHHALLLLTLNMYPQEQLTRIPFSISNRGTQEYGRSTDTEALSRQRGQSESCSWL